MAAHRYTPVDSVLDFTSSTDTSEEMRPFRGDHYDHYYPDRLTDRHREPHYDGEEAYHRRDSLPYHHHDGPDREYGRYGGGYREAVTDRPRGYESDRYEDDGSGGRAYDRYDHYKDRDTEYHRYEYDRTGYYRDEARHRNEYDTAGYHRDDDYRAREYDRSRYQRDEYHAREYDRSDHHRGTNFRAPTYTKEDHETQSTRQGRHDASFDGRRGGFGAHSVQGQERYNTWQGTANGPQPSLQPAQQSWYQDTAFQGYSQAQPYAVPHFQHPPYQPYQQAYGGSFYPQSQPWLTHQYTAPTHPSLSAGAPAFAPSFAPINAPPPQRMPLQSVSAKDLNRKYRVNKASRYPQAQTFSRAINPAFFAQNVPPSPYPAWMPSRHEPLSKWQAPSGPAPSQSQSELPFRSSPIPPPPPRSPHQDPIKFLIKRPEPTSAYRTQAALDPQTLDKPHRLLIVLDLNGTLLFRKRAGSTFVARPRVHDFLRYLIAHHEVLIWSSARQQNVTNIVDNLFTKEQKPKLVGVWARDKLRLSAEHYNQRVQVYKQLSWIWNDPLIIAESCAEGYHWSQANSVMIDDSLEKAASEPYNLIRIDEFEGKEEQKKVDVLGQVVKYLEKLRWQQDVSAYMRSSPFVFDTAAEAYDWSEIV